MNRLSLIAVMAVVVLALVGGAMLLTSGRNGPTAVPTSSAAPTTAPSPTQEPVVALPTAVWGDWHAEGVDVPGLTTNDLVRLSFNWEAGKLGWLQFDGKYQGPPTFKFEPLAAADGELRLRTSERGMGCFVGDVGHYRWSRSADGLFLTVELIADECATRGTTFARTWVHSLSAVNDGGTGVIPASPWIQVTLPHKRFAMSGGTDAADIHTFNQSDPFRGLLQLVDPMGFRAPCETANQPFAITRTVAAFERYLQTMPNLQLGTGDSAVDGIPGRRFEGLVVPGTPCPAGGAALFRSRIPTETDAVWSYETNDQFFIWAIERGGHLYVFSWDGNGATVDEGQAVIDSIKFTDKLPAP